MQNKPLNFKALLIVTTTTNILNPNITSLAGPVGFTMTQPFLLIRHIRVTNVTTSAATVTLYKSTTGDNTLGKEICKGKSVPANDSIDFYFPPGEIFTSADFLVGGSNTASALVVEGEGEIGVS